MILKKRYYLLLLIFLFSKDFVNGQTDALQLRNALLYSIDMESDLQELCDEIGGRVTGSKANADAVLWAYNKFVDASVNARMMPFEMPILWLPKTTSIKASFDHKDIEIQGVSKYQTAPGNYKAKLINVGLGDKKTFEENKEEIVDNFIIVETELCLDIDGLFAEYIHAANVERLAEQYAAKGIIFMASRPRGLLYRFITSRTIDNQMPQFVVVREDAKRIRRLLEDRNEIIIEIIVQAKIGEKFQSHNVIAEFRGTEKPEEIIVIGAHIDSWALGTGANDNGCNVAMMIDIARKMKALNIKPKRTIRFALWNGEEQGYFGSWAYIKEQKAHLDKHKLAVSIDIGSGEIVGFFTNGREDVRELVNHISKRLIHPDTLTQLNIPIIGTDNFDFMMEGVPNLVGIHKPQVYGINYHASSDTYDKVDLDMLKKNAAMVAELILKYANQDEIKLHRNTRDEIQKIIDTHQLEFTLKMFNVWDGWVDGTRGRN